MKDQMLASSMNIVLEVVLSTMYMYLNHVT